MILSGANFTEIVSRSWCYFYASRSSPQHCSTLLLAWKADNYHDAVASQPRRYFTPLDK